MIASFFEDQSIHLPGIHDHRSHLAFKSGDYPTCVQKKSQYMPEYEVANVPKQMTRERSDGPSTKNIVYKDLNGSNLIMSIKMGGYFTDRSAKKNVKFPAVPTPEQTFADNYPTIRTNKLPKSYCHREMHSDLELTEP